ncbi:MAG: NADH-quinone oxidoreductase subunit J family protein [Opitutaceae bacterium]
MTHVLFVIFAVFTIGCALGVVANRNAVNGAMCLLLCLAGVAGLFIQLNAYLLAFLLLLVYAGAVVALFLFIIMLLDVRGQDPVKRPVAGVVTALLAGAALLLGLVSLCVHSGGALPGSPPVAPVGASLHRYAELLFSTYLLIVEIVGFLLLIAMIGVIVLSRRVEPPRPRSSAAP